MTPKTITAATPLELAALRAVFETADSNWYGSFMDNVQTHLYEELGLLNDDADEQLDMDALSDLMVRWHRSVLK